MAYGKDITPNILESVGHNKHDSASVTLDIVLALITLHLLFSFTIVLNPVSQHFEELLRIPQSKLGKLDEETPVTRTRLFFLFLFLFFFFRVQQQ